MDDLSTQVEDQQQQQQQQHQGALARSRTVPLLSRIAESMFWIGRYVERAEDTARILDVQTQLLLEDSTGDEETTCRNLLSVMGVELSEVGVGRPVVGALDARLRPHRARLDRRRPGRGARERPPGARDAVGDDVGGAQHHAPPRRDRPVQPDGPGRELPLGPRPGGDDQRRGRRVR